MSTVIMRLLVLFLTFAVVTAVSVRLAMNKSALVVPFASSFVNLPPSPTETPPLDDSDVALILRRVFILPTNAVSTKKLPQGNIFHRPNKLVLFAIDSLSMDVAQELQLDNLLSGTALPVSSEKSLSTQTMVRDVADDLRVYFENEEAFICISGSMSVMASCNSKKSYRLISEILEQVTADSILSSDLWDTLKNKGGSIDIIDNEVIIHSANGDSFYLSLNDENHRFFFEELALLSSPKVFSIFEDAVGESDKIPTFVYMKVSCLSSMEPSARRGAAVLLDSAFHVIKGKNKIKTKHAIDDVWLTLLNAFTTNEYSNHNPVRISATSRHLLAKKNTLQANNGLLKKLDAPTPTPSPVKDSFKFDAEWQSFQLQLWTMIGLFIIGYSSSYMLYNLDYGHDDSGLFSKFKPDNSDMGNM